MAKKKRTITKTKLTPAVEHKKEKPETLNIPAFKASPHKAVEPKKPLVNTVERELANRKHLRRAGAFRKDTSKANKQAVSRSLAEVGRSPADGWDTEIVIRNM